MRLSKGLKFAPQLTLSSAVGWFQFVHIKYLYSRNVNSDLAAKVVLWYILPA